MHNLRLRFLTITLLLVAAFSFNLQANETSLEHSPVFSWYNESPLLIQAKVYPGANLTILKVTLYYRQKDSTFFNQEEMKKNSDYAYQGIIPKEIRTLEGIEYYIEVLDSSYVKRTYPSFMASITPQFVKVREDIETKYIQLVLPENRYNLQTTQPFFMYNYNENDGYSLNPENLLFYLDNQNITELVNISYFTANFKPAKPLSKGKHIINIYENTASGKQLRLITSFIIGKEKKQTYTGYISQKISRFDSTNTGNMQSQIQDELTAYAETSFKDNFLIKAKALMSAKESTIAQPVNRFYLLANTYSKNLSLKFGDSNPVYSDFSLNGILSRGFEFLYSTDMLDLAVNIGETQRAIEGDTSANALGTFAQKLSGFKGSVNFGNIFFWDTSFIHIYDDKYSILDPGSSSNSPKENIIGSLKSRLLLDDGKIVINSEVAGSVYYRNTEAATEKTDQLPEWLTNIFTPKSGINVDGAVKIGISMPLLGFNNIKAHVSQVGSSYNTLGNSSLTSDRREFYCYDKVFFLSRFIYLSGSYKYAYDNIPALFGVALQPYRTTYKTLNLSSGITFPHLPTIIITGIKDDKVNDTSGDQARNNTNLSLSASLRNIGFSLWGFNINFGLNGNYLEFTDNTSQKLLPDFKTISYSGNSELAFKENWSWSLNAGSNTKTDKASSSQPTDILTTQDNVSTKFSINFPIINTKGYLRVSWVWGKNSEDTLNIKKTQPEIGVFWKPTEKHSLDAKISFLFYDDLLEKANDYSDRSLIFNYKVNF